MIWISNIQYYKWFLTEIDTLPSWTKIVWTLILIRTRIVVNLWSKFFFFFVVVVDTCRVILKHDSLDLIWIRFNWMGLYVTRFHFSMKYHGLNRHMCYGHICLFAWMTISRWSDLWSSCVFCPEYYSVDVALSKAWFLLSHNWLIWGSGDFRLSSGWLMGLVSHHI